MVQVLQYRNGVENDGREKKWDEVGVSGRILRFSKRDEVSDA